jgi:sortase A
VLTHRAAAAVLTALAAWQLGQGLYIPLKALLAQQLIAAAWARSQHGGPGVRPWPGADFEPAARLRVPQRGVDLIVLGDASARSLAFGPGWMTGPPWAGETVSALAGHRDTHFRFVRELRGGDWIEIQAPAGGWRRYRVAAIAVIDPGDGPLRLECAGECVALVTCHGSRRSRRGEPLRIVATALRDERGAAQQGGRVTAQAPSI